MSPTYGHVTKIFLESVFQQKGNKQTKNAISLQNLAVVMARTDSGNKYYTEKDKNKFVQNCHH